MENGHFHHFPSILRISFLRSILQNFGFYIECDLKKMENDNFHHFPSILRIRLRRPILNNLGFYIKHNHNNNKALHRFWFTFEKTSKNGKKNSFFAILTIFQSFLRNHYSNLNCRSWNFAVPKCPQNWKILNSFEQKTENQKWISVQRSRTIYWRYLYQKLIDDNVLTTVQSLNEIGYVVSEI